VRKVVNIDIAGQRLVGTYHLPENGDGPSSARDVAVLILNFAQLPRAGLADMSVHLADEHAANGFPAFRFDMPGLGDSPGELPRSERLLWDFTENGGYAQCAAALVEQLIQRFELRGIVLGGLCGGAITSLFAADQWPAGVLGLILLEPTYFLVGSPGSQMPGRTPRKKNALRNGKSNLRQRLLTTLKNNADSIWLRPLRKGFLSLRHGRDRIFGPRFPDGINHPLVLASRRVAARALPILCVNAGSKQRWLHQYQVFGHVKGRRITFVEIEGTNHMLVPGGGQAKVVEQVGSWLRKTYRASHL